MRVNNIYSTKGNCIANQFIIEDNGKIAFQSYDSIIAVVDKANKVVEIGTDHDYSKTTMKYASIFFNDYVRIPSLSAVTERRKAIKKGSVEGYKVLYNPSL